MKPEENRDILVSIYGPHNARKVGTERTTKAEEEFSRRLLNSVQTGRLKL